MNVDENVRTSSSAAEASSIQLSSTIDRTLLLYSLRSETRNEVKLEGE